MTPLQEVRARMENRLGGKTNATDVVRPLKQVRSGLWRRRALWICGAGGLLLAAAWAANAWLRLDVSVPRERLQIATVQRGTFVRDVTAQGKVVAANRLTLFAPATGLVSFRVTSGAKVNKGDVLATISSEELISELRREKAALAKLESDAAGRAVEVRRQAMKRQSVARLAGVRMAAARRELERAEAAWKVQAIPQRDVLRAHDEFQAAQIEHEESLATAALDNDSLRFELKALQEESSRQKLVTAELERRIGELTIRSPVTGMTGDLVASQRDMVIANAPLLSVVDLSQLEIEFRAPDVYADLLGLDMQADVSYSAERFAARVTALSPEIRDNQLTGRVRFVQRAPAGLRQNQRVTVRIVIDSRPGVLKVARGPFLELGGAAYVVRDDVASRRPIRIGAIGATEIEILSGLAAGDRIVVSDIGAMGDAAAVRLTD